MTRESGVSSRGRVQAALFLRGLYRFAPSGSLVEVRFRTVDGMGRRFHEVERLGRVVETVLELAGRTDVYVGVLPRQRRGGTRADLVEAASVAWVDCDTASSVAELRRFRPAPGMIVASGSAQNCHAYWLLEDSVELDVIESINRCLALTLGADRRCGDAARILRPAGSVNRKQSPPAVVRLLRRAENQRVPVAELERLMAEPRKVTARRTPRDQPSATADPLAAIPPRVYFERLTGQAVGRSGKACCPFHDDRTPSLHVYEDPDRGWYCFGCGRGGSIYDLAGLLWRRGTRGQEFVALRRELQHRMGL
jgi:CHC2 zinc finger/RepB DNA-primase from phage plasmid